MKFTYDVYRKVILNLTSFLEVESFTNYSKTGKLYLRHDVDIFAENVLNFAMLENDIGVFSIYFFQPNSEFYNLLSPNILKIIQKLKDFGHLIGLHIDTHNISETEKIEDCINNYYSFYNKFIPLEKIISFHRPPKSVMNTEIEGYTSVYGKKYFHDIRYFSDSKRREFLYNMTESISKDGKTSIQLLTHPYWWDHMDLDIWESYERFFKVKQRVLEKALARESEPYKKLFKRFLED